MIELNDIKKSYGDHIVFDQVNLSVQKGSILGLIGANGAGKTTLLKILLHKIEYEGTVTIDGKTNYDFIKGSRSNIVYYPDEPFLYEYLTGMEFIRFIIDIQKIKFNSVIKEKAAFLLKVFDLDEYKNHLIKEYSFGMKRKLRLITILIQSPQILILDEPVSGFDIKSIIIFKKLLKQLAATGTTIIFSTHIIELIENMCDNVAIIHDRQIISLSNAAEMSKNDLEKYYINLINSDIDEIVAQYQSLNL